MSWLLINNYVTIIIITSQQPCIWNVIFHNDILNAAGFYKYNML